MKRIKLIIAVVISFSFISPAFAAYSPAPGDLVKGSFAAVYYVTAAGKRLAFPNEDAYFSWYANFNSVKTVSDNELALLPLAGLITLRPGLDIVKTPVSSRVYAVAHGGTLRWLANETVAKLIFGADWTKKIIVIPEEFLSAYKYSTDITTGGQYWWQKERDASPNIAANENAMLSPDLVADNPAMATPAPQPVAPIEPVAVSNAGPTVKNVLYILWDPKRLDNPAPSKATLERVLFGSAPSMSDYYASESNNHIRINNAGVLGWYTADKNPVEYWSNDPLIHQNDGFKTGAAERIAEALNKASADFDFRKYDLNNDKKITPDELGIFIVIPQLGEPVDDIVTPYAAEDPAATAYTSNGITIGSVAELYVGTPLGDKNKFGTLLHSFARYVLGLADYATNDSDKFSLGNFSLLSAPHTDLRLDPYTRIVLGWATPKVIPKALEVSVQDLNSSLPERSIIRIDRDQPGGPAPGTEYFLLENRQRGIYDSALPDEGVVIWDISGTSVRLLHLDPTLPINDANALWRSKNGAYAPTGLELFWASDGARSGVQLMNLGASSGVMNFTLSKKILDDISVRTPPSPLQ